MTHQHDGSTEPTEDDVARTRRLSTQLVALQDGSERLSRLVRVACQRTQEQREIWDLDKLELGVEWANAPLTLPPVELMVSEATGEPVPVVAGEALVQVAPDERGRVGDHLRDAGLRVDDDCSGVLRVGPRAGEERDTRALLRELDGLGVSGSPHHAGALRGDMKSADGPEYTDSPPDAQWFVAHKDEGAGACVVAVDTGLDPLAIAGKRDDPWLHDMRNSEVDPLDVFDEITGAVGPDGYLDGGAGHGTFVAGVVRQIAPAADVRVLRALDTRGLGTECEIARAIRRAIPIFRNAGNRGVLNLSLGIQTVDGLPPPAVEQALWELPDDVLVVAAAGNVPLDEPIWPAWSKRAIGVGALTRKGGTLIPAPWSNSGHHVDFSAVGDGVSSTYVSGDEHPSRDQNPERFPRLGRRKADPPQKHAYALWSGTSFSTPKVAGLLAVLLMEMVHAKEPRPAAAALQALRENRSYLRGYGYLIDM